MTLGRTPNRLHANPKLKPPGGLTAPAAAAFKFIVDSVDRDHFSEVDIPLLVEYCRSIEMASTAAKHIDEQGAVSSQGKQSPWIVVQEKAQRSMVALCARLRLSPQSRFDRLVAGTNSRQQYPRPWEEDDDGLLASPENGSIPKRRKPKTGLASFR